VVHTPATTPHDTRPRAAAPHIPSPPDLEGNAVINREHEFVAGRMAELQAQARVASRAHRLVAAQRAARRADKAARRAARAHDAIF
jgi:hypothetical protein